MQGRALCARAMRTGSPPYRRGAVHGRGSAHARPGVKSDVGKFWGRRQVVCPSIRAVRARAVRPGARGGAPAPRRGAGTGVTSALGAVAWGNRHMRPTRPGTRAVRARVVRPSARGGAEANVTKKKRLPEGNRCWWVATLGRACQTSQRMTMQMYEVLTKLTRLSTKKALLTVPQIVGLVAEVVRLSCSVLPDWV